MSDAPSLTVTSEVPLFEPSNSPLKTRGRFLNPLRTSSRWMGWPASYQALGLSIVVVARSLSAQHDAAEWRHVVDASLQDVAADIVEQYVDAGQVLWETILGSQITGYLVTYAVDGRQYLTVPVGGVGNRLARYAPELKAPTGSNMLVTFTLPE